MGIAVVTEALETLLLTAAVETLGSAPLHNAIMALYQNNVALTPTTTKDNLSLATYDGYEPVTFAGFKLPYRDLAGDIVTSPSTPATFTCTGQTVTNTLYGAALLDSTGNTLLAAQSFDTAITPVTGLSFNLTPELNVTGSINACLC